MEYSPSLGIQVEEAGMKYVDRGDPSSPDFTVFTFDNAYHDLDLSSIVPEAGANHPVHLFIRGQTSVPPDVIRFRKKGNVNTLNQGGLWVPVSGLASYNGDLLVTMDANRVIEYVASASASGIYVLVRGWIEE